MRLMFVRPRPTRTLTGKVTAHYVRNRGDGGHVRSGVSGSGVPVGPRSPADEEPGLFGDYETPRNERGAA